MNDDNPQIKVKKHYFSDNETMSDFSKIYSKRKLKTK